MPSPAARPVRACDALAVLLSAALVWAGLLGAGVCRAQRLAWTGDVNYHDRDDWGATPMALALLDDAGRSSQRLAA